MCRPLRMRALGAETRIESMAVALCDELEAEIRRLDPLAMEDVEAFWPLILEQTRDGLM
ncbi:MAG TPA: SUKH-4 family immunity protein [Kofleriaceae bacterium]|nr:SUKH-4 family immunity protein [Kofleriaceae bacterium]